MGNNICRLCGNSFLDEDMSEEHYPAKCVGNDDIVLFDIVKMFDSLNYLYQKEFISKDDLTVFADKSFEKCVVKIYTHTEEQLGHSVKNAINFLGNMMSHI